MNCIANEEIDLQVHVNGLFVSSHSCTVLNWGIRVDNLCQRQIFFWDWSLLFTLLISMEMENLVFHYGSQQTAFVLVV